MRHVFILFLAALLAASLPAHAATPLQQSRELQAQGRAAYKAGNFAEAVKDFKAALALRPHHPGLLLNLAASLAKAGRTADAINTLAEFAGMGLITDADNNADFAALKGDRAFRDVLAKLAANAKPVGRSTIVATVSGTPFLAEGLAVDPANNRLFVSSVDQRKILVLSQGGQREFASSASGLLGAFGITVDAARQRLWVASSGFTHVQGLSESERGAVGVFSFALADGRLLSKAVLPKAKDEQIIGDIALTENGELFATDSITPVIYTVERDGAALTAWLRHENFSSLQGVTATPDGAHLIVADYANGLHVIDRKTKTFSTIGFAGGTTLLGIDGLYRAGSTLIAVQNGMIPQRILALALDPSGTNVLGVNVLSANDPNIPEPSLGAPKGNEFCVVANAQWSRFNDDGSRKPDAPLDSPRVACIKLN
jgi:hypothetical protein